MKLWKPGDDESRLVKAPAPDDRFERTRRGLLVQMDQEKTDPRVKLLDRLAVAWESRSRRRKQDEMISEDRRGRLVLRLPGKKNAEVRLSSLPPVPNRRERRRGTRAVMARMRREVPTVDGEGKVVWLKRAPDDRPADQVTRRAFKGIVTRRSARQFNAQALRDQEIEQAATAVGNPTVRGLSGAEKRRQRAMRGDERQERSAMALRQERGVPSRP